MSSSVRNHNAKGRKISRTAAEPVEMPATSLDRARWLKYAAMALGEVSETSGQSQVFR